MLYETDFNIPFNNKNQQEQVNRNSFNILMGTERNDEKNTRFSIARSLLPLSYISSILAMKSHIYHNNTIKETNIFYKFHCLFVISIFFVVTFVNKPVGWKQTASDLPLNLLTKTFTFLQSTELIYAVFIISFGNSKYYVQFYQIIDNIDGHFGYSEKVFKKRLVFATFMMTLPPLIVGSVFLVRPFNINFLLSYLTFSFVTFHGVTLVSPVIIIYVQVLVFNVILKRKLSNVSPSKDSTFKDDTFTRIFRKCLHSVDSVPADNSYSWFQLMQIYDKLSDAIYLYNKIYSTQILIMLNSWLLTTMLVLCRSLTPALKYSAAIRTDMYYYTFINLRPFFLTKISESLQHERRKALIYIIHALLYQEQETAFEEQIRTMIDLVQNKKLTLSAVIFPVNLPIMFAFAGRVISYAVMFIQNFYLTTDTSKTD